MEILYQPPRPFPHLDNTKCCQSFYSSPKKVFSCSFHVYVFDYHEHLNSFFFLSIGCLWFYTLSLCVSSTHVWLRMLLVFFLSIFYWLCYYSFFNFSPLSPLCPAPPNPPALPPLSPWAVHISSLTSLFPIPFLTSPHLFYAYHLCCLFSIPSPPFFTSPSPLKTHHAMSISLILFLFQLFNLFLFFKFQLLIVVSLLSFLSL